MADRASALARLPGSSPNSMPAGGSASLSEDRPASILQVAAWPGTIATVRAVIGELLQIQAPEPGLCVTGPALTLMAVAPGRYLVAAAAPDLVPRFEAALPAADGAVTDLSHGRVILRLDGSVAAAILAKGAAIDLDDSVFPPGRVAQTMIHHVDVTIVRRSAETFDIWVLRSFAESMAEWLLDAGLEFGIALRRS